MGLLKEINQMQEITEREQVIRTYILKHPEKISGMSSRELGEVTYSSAAAVVRFCKKLGYKGYPDFKLQFLTELKSMDAEQYEKLLQISSQENMVSIVQKVSEVQKRAYEMTKKELSLEQLARIGEMLYEAESVDFYAYDTNVYLAQYGCSQLLHCGKIANTYVATNVQELHALVPKKKHVAIVISHTGENSRLVEIVKTLKKNQTKTIVITSDKRRTLFRMADEALYAAGAENVDEFWTAMFFSSVKYLLDIMFGMEFSHHYQECMKLNQSYEKVGKKIWALLHDV